MIGVSAFFARFLCPIKSDKGGALIGERSVGSQRWCKVATIAQWAHLFPLREHRNHGVLLRSV